MNHVSLFTGFGGFDLAAKWMEWNNVAHCEINPFCRRILQYYWPKAISYDDIRTTDFTVHRGEIDLLTGGFPCQPFSTAGKRKGTADDRYLWTEMLRAIREISPRWVVGENVRGLVNWNGGMVFDQVQADLEAEGYEVIPFLLPAASVNAPHKRDRIWFIAYTASVRCNGDFLAGEGVQRDQQACGEIRASACEERIITHTNHRSQQKHELRAGRNLPRNRDSTNGVTPNYAQFPQREQTNEINAQPESGEARVEPGSIHDGGPFADAKCNQRSEGRRDAPQSHAAERHLSERDPWDGRNWQHFPSEPPLCSGNDGISRRLDRAAVFEGVKESKRKSTLSRWREESLKGFGNAIVPQVAYQIFKSIEQYEQLS